jgi:hypothetical protein
LTRSAWTTLENAVSEYGAVIDILGVALAPDQAVFKSHVFKTAALEAESTGANSLDLFHGCSAEKLI